MKAQVDTLFHLMESRRADGNTGMVPASMRYDPTDPYAVTLVLGHEPNDHVTWCFGRDLLAAGCDGHAGEMDVQMWPGPPGVFLRLSSPEGVAVLVMPRPDVRRFLRRSYALVARGRESEHVDVDAALARLLAGA